MEHMKILHVLLLVITLSVTFATSNVSQRIENALCEFYNFLSDILPLVVIVVIALAAVVFVIGTVFGAETRARANVWATNMLIYTLIGILILIGVPYILQQLYPPLNPENICQGG